MITIKDLENLKWKIKSLYVEDAVDHDIIDGAFKQYEDKLIDRVQ